MAKHIIVAAMAVVYLCLAWLLYGEAFTAMVGWWKSDTYNHCYLVPLVIAYLVWTTREQWLRLPSRVMWVGAVPFLFGLGLFWVGELGGEYYTLYLSAWLVLVGILWMHLGWERIKALGFPLFLVLTLFPFPNFINTKISVQLQLVSSWLGVAIIQFFGMPVYREGNVIDLGFTTLQVVDACSGLRYILPLVVLAIVLAYFFRARLWKRILLIVSAVPIAVVLNSGRIAMTGVLSKWFGPAVAEGFFHEFSGWLLFMLSLGILLMVMGILRLLPGKPLMKGRIGTVLQSSLTVREGDGGWRVGAVGRFVFAAGLIAICLVAASQVEFREKIPVRKSLTGFPLEVGQWRGVPKSLAENIVDTLDLSEYALIEYQDTMGRNISFYLAYYESQRKGESIHSPETCLPGSGLEFTESGEITFPMPSSSSGNMTVNRAFVQSGDFRQLVYFWFPQRGRILTNAVQLKLFAFWDALTKHRTDGALVRVITPLAPGESVVSADERIQEFVRLLQPILEDHLPGKST